MRVVQSVSHLFAHGRPLKALAVSGVLALGGLFLGAPASVAGQAFGGAVLVADGQVLVGEAAHERDPGTVRGYTFDGEWTEVWSLRAPEPAVQDGFGRRLPGRATICLSGRMAVMKDGSTCTALPRSGPGMRNRSRCSWERV